MVEKWKRQRQFGRSTLNPRPDHTDYFLTWNLVNVILSPIDQFAGKILSTMIPTLVTLTSFAVVGLLSQLRYQLNETVIGATQPHEELKNLVVLLVKVIKGAQEVISALGPAIFVWYTFALINFTFTFYLLITGIYTNQYIVLHVIFQIFLVAISVTASGHMNDLVSTEDGQNWK